MASTIVQRIIGGLQENAIQCNNSQFGRMVTLVSGWSKVRVGIRLHMTDSGANIISTPRLALGFGHGVTNMVGDASCDHWAGFITIGASFARQPTYYATGAGSPAFAKKVGATLTTSAGVDSNVPIGNQAAGTGTDREIFFLDLTKGSPNYNFNSFWRNGGSLPADASSATFLSLMTQSAPVLTGYTYVGPTALAVSEIANGTFNAVQFWWDKTDASMEVCDLAVAVLA